MMMIKTIKSGKAHSFWLLLPVMLFLLSGCSKESSEDPEPGSTYAPVKFSLDIVSPEMGSTLLASVAEGGQINTRFYSRMNEGASKTILVRQDGKMINLGKLPVTLTNTSGTEGRIEIDGTDKVDGNKPYDVYVIGCSARWDDSDVYYRTDMSRAGSFGTWLKFSSGYRPSKATSNIAGTDEILFVINKSGAPIKFKHKGFDADKKWYYKYAEVSMNNGTVVASEDGEVEGVESDVPVFTGSNARGIYSFYVPNGNKIQDAQLVAEINGVEVRSTNRISSDIMIQQNQSYAMFAVWDGEKLTLGDGEGDPVVIVCSDTNSGVIVNEVRNDGTIILSASSTTIPKEGEIIVSGVTPAAPYGFLYHVEKVQQSGGQVIIKTSPAYLNEVLKDAHVEEPLSFREATTRGGSIPSRSIDFNLFDWKGKFTLTDKPGGTVSFGGLEFEEYVKGEVSVGIKMGGTFIWDSSGFLPDRCGIMLDGSLSASVSVEVGLKSKFEKKFTEVKLEPIVIVIAGIPVVISPNIVWKYGISTAESKIYAKWKPVDIDAWGFDARLIWHRDDDAYGSNWDYGAETTSDFADWSWKGFFNDMLNFEAGLEGEVKFAVWPELSFQLYDLDNVALSAGIQPYAKVKGELAVKWKANDWNWDDFELKDNLSLSVGLDVPLEGKVEFSFFGEKLGGTLSESLTILDNPLIEGATLMPVFNDFRIYPEEDAWKHEFVNVSADKGAVLMTLFADMEDDYGFCISEVKKDISGFEYPREWTFYSLKEKYAGVSYGLDRQMKIELDIPTANLKRAATYEIRPYTVIKVGNGTFVFKRKGGKFNTGGGTGEGGGTVTDVPGEDL